MDRPKTADPRAGALESLVMGDLVEDPNMFERVNNLTPAMRDAFLEAMDKLYDKESRVLLTVFQNSRDAFTGEQDMMRSSSATGVANFDRLKIEENSQQAVQRYLKQREKEQAPKLTKAAAKQQDREVDYEVEEKLAIERYLRKSGRDGLGGKFDKEGPKEKEGEKLMSVMEQAKTTVESERERQKRRVEELKAKQKAKQDSKTRTAEELLEQAGRVDSARARDKSKHGEKVKERLEEMKKQKSKKGEAHEEASPDTPAGEEPPKEKKKKDKDKDTTEGAVAAEEEGKEKKKKKKRDEENGGEGEEAAAGDEEKEKKKKKKKDKEKAEGEEAEAADGGKEKKKKKKKDKE